MNPEVTTTYEVGQLIDHLHQVIQKDLGISVAHFPGAGAAGGMGAGCMVFLNAQLKSGIDCVLDTIGFDTILKGTDLVITGEGRIDRQSIQGKVISGIAKRTKPRGVPLIAVVGSIAEEAALGYDFVCNCNIFHRPLRPGLSQICQYFISLDDYIINLLQVTKVPFTTYN